MDLHNIHGHQIGFHGDTSELRDYLRGMHHDDFNKHLIVASEKGESDPFRGHDGKEYFVKYNKHNDKHRYSIEEIRDEN